MPFYELGNIESLTLPSFEIAPTQNPLGIFFPSTTAVRVSVLLLSYEVSKCNYWGISDVLA